MVCVVPFDNGPVSIVLKDYPDKVVLYFSLIILNQQDNIVNKTGKLVLKLILIVKNWILLVVYFPLTLFVYIP